MSTAADWLALVRSTGTPLLTDDSATFVWFGKRAPVLIGDFNLWGIGSTPYPRLEEVAPRVWTYTLPLLPRTYQQYTFTTDPEDSKARLVDPFNRHPVAAGYGQYNASFWTADYPHTQLPPHYRLNGTLGKFRRAHPFLLGKKRDLWLYQPPTPEPVPLLLVYDGQDAVHLGRLPQLVDHLITTGQIAPLALACIAHADRGRLTEYTMSEALLLALVHAVLPFATKHLHLLSPTLFPGAYGVMGASLGGLMALYTALRLPHLFGTVISQSGAFQLALDEEKAPLLASVLWQNHTPLRIWQDVGRYEWLHTVNERVHIDLVAAGHEVTYRVYNSGHNWPAWHAIMADALRAMFPPVTARE